MTITHENDLAEMGRMLAIIADLRAELAAQQAYNVTADECIQMLREALETIVATKAPEQGSPAYYDDEWSAARVALA